MDAVQNMRDPGERQGTSKSTSQEEVSAGTTIVVSQLTLKSFTCLNTIPG
jgi:hypothetical protein